ncbi:MAG: MFS transporter [Dehalococcoidales bacterium]|nr:MAG: MFS transporter [Dehalococcoidales bacterium]
MRVYTGERVFDTATVRRTSFLPPVPGTYSEIKQRLHSDVFGRFPRGVWVIAGTQLFASAGFSICLPFFALYLHEERGLLMTLVGSLYLISGICSSTTQMIGGVLADRFGRRRLILGSSVIRLFIYSGLSVLVATSAPVWAIIITYVSGQAVGMAMRPAIAAMITDLSPPDRLTETYGVLRVGQNVGWAAGPALGGYLITFMPYSWLFAIAAFSSVFTFVFIFFFLSESFHATGERVPLSSMFNVTRDHLFLVFTGLCLLVFVTMGQMGSTLSVFTVTCIGFSTAQYGLLLTANGIMVVLFQYPVARWAGKMPITRGLALGSLLYALGYLSLGGVHSFNWAIAAMVIITAGEIVFTPLTLSVVARLSPPDYRGRYMGFFGLSQSMSMSLAPLVGGVLLDTFPQDPWFVWGTIATVALIATLGILWWGNNPRLSTSSNENAQL